MHSTIRYDQNSINKRDIDDIPECLQKYLINIEEPHDSYEHTCRVHDQRIRLLLRRFINQIQYGCKNIQCNVPTCLSYRKRNATRPVRPYIDVAAQALATQCVERCVGNGSLDEIFSKEKKKQPQVKTKYTSESRKTGLCYSEPVVPWYSHPDDRSRRANSGRRSPTQNQNGFARKPAAVPPDCETNGTIDSRLTMHSKNHSRKPDIASPPTNLAGPEPSLRDSSEQDAPQSSQQRPDESQDHTSELEHGQGGETLKAQQLRPRKKDHASFTQWLFEREELRDYGNIQSYNVSASRNTENEVEGKKSARSKEVSASQLLPSSSQNTSLGAHILEDTQRVQPEFKEPTQPFHYGQVFRIMPTSVTLWLRSFGHGWSQRSKSNPSPQTSTSWALVSERPDMAQFIRQCMFFTFSDPRRLIISAASWDRYSYDSPESITPKLIEGHSRLDFESLQKHRKCVIPQRENLERVCRDLLVLLHRTQGLHGVDDVDAAFVLVGYMHVAIRRCFRQQYFTEPDKNGSVSDYSNSQIAHLILLVFKLVYGIMICVAVMSDIVSAYQNMDPTEDWSALDNARIREREVASNFQFEVLFTTIAALISNRVEVDMLRQMTSQSSRQPLIDTDIVSCIISILVMRGGSSSVVEADVTCIYRLLRVMQAALHREWDRRPVLERAAPTVGALEMLSAMSKHKGHLALYSKSFEMDEIGRDVDEIEVPFNWLIFQPDTKRTHILEYPFIFSPSKILRVFRSINLRIMKLSHERAMAVYAHAKTELVKSQWRVNGLDEVLEKTRAHMARYFVMTISRENLLEDAIGQIWRREHQELLRPLKVRIGKGQGEEGIDHGGVQQEFFRLVFAEAFDRKYGMFDIDPTSHMAWFKPGSLEPTYKYEALGILLGLAVFNGVTVPITMPLAVYKKVLGIPVLNAHDIEDGWPELSRSFEIMLEYEDGDVGDIIGRTYEFAYEAFGTIISVDMTKTTRGRREAFGIGTSSKGKERAYDPDEKLLSTDSEAPLVTNANREAYVLDYVDHLVNVSIKHQFAAFLRGLHTILSPRSLTLFSHSPKSLKLLVEGHPLSQPLDLDDWFDITTYDEYEPTDQAVVWFWEILRQDLDQIQLRKLLEFVTACNRIPVGGWEGVTFLIQKNGEGNERLPTSSTCYGRLLLPNYSSKAMLKQKLEKAIENSLGFGAL